MKIYKNRIGKKIILKRIFILNIVVIIGILLFTNRLESLNQVMNTKSNGKNEDIKTTEKLLIENNFIVEEIDQNSNKIVGNDKELKEEKKNLNENKKDEKENVGKNKTENNEEIMYIEYEKGLLTVNLQNVGIIEVLNKISELANIIIDIGPGVEGNIEKIIFVKQPLDKAMEKLIEIEGRGIFTVFRDEKINRIKVSKKPTKDFKQIKNEKEIEEDLLIIPKTKEGVKIQLRIEKIAAFDSKERRILKEYFIPNDISIVSSTRDILNRWENYNLTIQMKKAEYDALKTFEEFRDRNNRWRLSIIPIYCVEILNNKDKVLEKIIIKGESSKKLPLPENFQNETKEYDAKEAYLTQTDIQNCEISHDGKLWAYYNNRGYWIKLEDFTNPIYKKNPPIIQEEPLNPEMMVKIADPSGNILWEEKFEKQIDEVRISNGGEIIAFVPQGGPIYFKDRSGKLIYTYKKAVNMENFKFSKTGKFASFKLQNELIFIDILKGKSASKNIQWEDTYKFDERKDTIILFRNNKQYGEYNLDEFNK